LIVYAESSAVLAWLLGEPRGEEVRHALEGADGVVASRLTRLECLRTLGRLEATRQRTPSATERLLGVFARAAAEWVMIEVSAEVVERAAAPFPEEPVRALDAIHLASMLALHSVTPEVEMVALDIRVRRNAMRLGIAVRPS
jgi:uncharacterized protein with PIN domain